MTSDRALLLLFLTIVFSFFSLSFFFLMNKSNGFKFKATICHNVQSQLIDVYNLLKSLLRILIYSFFFWLLGRYGFSLIWLFLVGFIQTIERRFHLLRMERIKFFQELTNDIRPIIDKHLTELPLWLSYPDFDRCEWLNKLIERLWPSI